MHFKIALFVTVFVTVFSQAQTLSYLSNPFASLAKSLKVVKDENLTGKILSNVEADIRRIQAKKPFSSMLLRGKPMGDMPQLDKVNTPFNWTSCGPSSQLLNIKSLDVKPSPLSFPGTLTFSFDIVFRDNIEKSDNITVDVELWFKTGEQWMKLPCLGRIGSCTYKDLCSLLSGISCPSDVTKQGVRCNCPFAKGEYKLQPYTVEIDARVFIVGNYRAVINASSSTKGAVGCYKLAFQIM